MKSIPIAALAVLLAACSSVPETSTAGGPADPGARVPRQSYTPVTAGTVDYKPVEPQPWKRQNENVAPKQEQQQ